MCGIFGIIPIPQASINIDLVNKLTELSRTRGTHASGFLIWKSPSDWVVIKEPGFFLRLDPTDPDISSARFIMGHVRKASKGAFLDNAANHPHVINNLVLIHNGTAPSFLERAEKLDITNHGENDSYAILALIHRGMMAGETLINATASTLSLGKWGDTFALAVFNTDTGELVFARNDDHQDRPLIFSNRTGGVIFASEATFIAKSFGFPKQFGLPFSNTIECPKGTLVSCNVNDISSQEGEFIEGRSIPNAPVLNDWLGRFNNPTSVYSPPSAIAKTYPSVVE